MSRTPAPCALRIAISSRSAKDRERADRGAKLIGGIPVGSSNSKVLFQNSWCFRNQLLLLRSYLVLAIDLSVVAHRRNVRQPADRMGRDPIGACQPRPVTVLSAHPGQPAAVSRGGIRER